MAWVLRIYFSLTTRGKVEQIFVCVSVMADASLTISKPRNLHTASVHPSKPSWMNAGLVVQTGWRPGLLHAVWNQHLDFKSTHCKGHDKKYVSSQVELKFIYCKPIYSSFLSSSYPPATICGLIPDKLLEWSADRVLYFLLISCDFTELYFCFSDSKYHPIDDFWRVRLPGILCNTSCYRLLLYTLLSHKYVKPRMIFFSLFLG